MLLPSACGGALLRRAVLRSSLPLPFAAPLVRMCAWLLTTLLGLLALVPAWANPPSNPQWDFLLGRVMQHSGASRAAMINLAINQFEYQATPPGSARWQTPKEFVDRGAGSCQDFALAKFWLLRQSGVQPEQVRLALGRVHVGEQVQWHLVVLLWSDRGGPWVLDNLVPGMHRLAARQDLLIDFTFDETGFFDRDGRHPIAEQPLRGWRGTWQRVAMQLPAS